MNDDARRPQSTPIDAIGDDPEVRRHRHEAKVARAIAWVALILGVLLLVLANLTADERTRGSSGLVSMGLVALFGTSVVGFAKARAKKPTARVLDVATWSRSTFSIVEEVRGRHRRNHLKLDATGVTYVCGTPFVNPTLATYGHDVEWGQGQDGWIAVRRRYSDVVHVYRPETEDEAMLTRPWRLRSKES